MWDELLSSVDNSTNAIREDKGFSRKFLCCSYFVLQRHIFSIRDYRGMVDFEGECFGGTGGVVTLAVVVVAVVFILLREIRPQHQVLQLDWGIGKLGKWESEKTTITKQQEQQIEQLPYYQYSFHSFRLLLLEYP